MGGSVSLQYDHQIKGFLYGGYPLYCVGHSGKSNLVYTACLYFVMFIFNLFYSIFLYLLKENIKKKKKLALIGIHICSYIPDFPL